MIFTAGVNFYEEIDEVELRNKLFICANNFSEAIEKITSYYGEDNIDSISIFAFSPDDFLSFSEENYELFYDVQNALEKNVVW